MQSVGTGQTNERKVPSVFLIRRLEGDFHCKRREAAESFQLGSSAEFWAETDFSQNGDWFRLGEILSVLGVKSFSPLCFKIANALFYWN